MFNNYKFLTLQKVANIIQIPITEVRSYEKEGLNIQKVGKTQIVSRKEFDRFFYGLKEDH